jgi:hypothetical protein
MTWTNWFIVGICWLTTFVIFAYDRPRRHRWRAAVVATVGTAVVMLQRASW